MNNQSVKIKKQDEFPYIKEYREKFPIDSETVFVFGNKIYTNNELFYDVLHHELEHLRRMNKYGCEKWIKDYLDNDEFRLKEEKEAYLYQLKQVQKLGDNDELMAITTECINNISSKLYGSIISYRDAEKYFKDNLLKE